MKNDILKEIRQKHLLGQKDFKNLNLSRENLCGANLSELNFKQTDFSYANLQGANLTKANLIKCNFKGANLRGANLTKATFDDSDFSQSNLMGATLVDCHGRNSNFEKAHLNETNLSQGYLVAANFTQAFLNQSILTKANLHQAKLIGAFLTKANLTNAYLGKANLSGTSFTAVNLDRAYLRNAIYDNKTLFDIDFNPEAVGMELYQEESTHNLTIEDLLAGINYVAKCSNQYVGTVLTKKYLTISKPNQDWLNQFQINDKGIITFTGLENFPINDFQIKWYRKWLNIFISHCSMIIGNFSELIDLSQLPYSFIKLEESESVA